MTNSDMPVFVSMGRILKKFQALCEQIVVVRKTKGSRLEKIPCHPIRTFLPSRQAVRQTIIQFLQAVYSSFKKTMTTSESLRTIEKDRNDRLV